MYVFSKKQNESENTLGIIAQKTRVLITKMDVSITIFYDRLGHQ